MSEALATVEVETPVTAVPKVKPAPKPKLKIAKGTADKVKAKPAPKVASTDGPTIRDRVFKLLAKNADGLTGAQIKDKLQLGGVPSLLKDEGVCEKPRLKRTVREDVRGVVYVLTALGRKAVEADKIDENAAPSAAGKDWNDGK